ncbi:MAG: hypothetical protein KAJ06_06655 [Gammaproteobacteria bacterium]|nr:hypothetical protein [Gammaproteobacteria bacterium]
MKKVLSTVAALALVAGVASNAMALDKPGRASEVPATTAPRVPVPTAPGVALWSVAGQWVLAGALINGGMGDGTSGGSGAAGGADVQGIHDNTDAFYIYSFKILPVLQVNDKISVKGELRFADRCIFGKDCGSESGDRDMDIKHVFMEWTSPIGKTRFGRTPAGGWGTKFMDNGAQGDRLMLWPNFMPDNWGALLFTQKITENDATTPGVSDGDVDGYYVDLNYTADFGKTIAAVFAKRTADNTAINDSLISTQLWVTGNYKFGDFGVVWEWNQAFGDGDPEPGFTEESDASGTGIMLDLNYQMDDWTFGGLFFYMTGDDDITDNDTESLFGSKGVGNDYNPYQILTGDYMGLLQGDKSTGGAHSALFNGPGDHSVSGVISIGGYVKFAVSPKLSVNAAVGYAGADEEPDGFDDDYGIEFGVGAAYKIMDNLSYNAHFSFLSTGDYWDEGGTMDTEDVYLIAHALSMKF